MAICQVAFLANEWVLFWGGTRCAYGRLNGNSSAGCALTLRGCQIFAFVVFDSLKWTGQKRSKNFLFATTSSFSGYPHKTAGCSHPIFSVLALDDCCGINGIKRAARLHCSFPEIWLRVSTKNNRNACLTRYTAVRHTRDSRTNAGENNRMGVSLVRPPNMLVLLLRCPKR